MNGKFRRGQCKSNLLYRLILKILFVNIGITAHYTSVLQQPILDFNKLKLNLNLCLLVPRLLKVNELSPFKEGSKNMRIVKQIISLLNSMFFLKRKGINISPLAYYDKSCNFQKNIYIDRFCNLHSVKISEYSYVGYSTSINYCKIGKYCSIGADVKIGLSKHPLTHVSTSPIFYSDKNYLGVKLVDGTQFKEVDEVIIGNDVWIGSNAIVMGGIIIGDGAVIGAGSVVTKNVEPYSIVGGVPAKIIKYRFTGEEIKSLLNIKWWDWGLDEIKKNIDKFKNIERIIK